MRSYWILHLLLWGTSTEKNLNKELDQKELEINYSNQSVSLLQSKSTQGVVSFSPSDYFAFDPFWLVGLVRVSLVS